VIFPATVRVLVSALMSILLLIYVGGIVTGRIPEARRVDAVTLALLTLGSLMILLVLQPGLLARFKTLEVGGLKLELDRLREQQSVQKDELENLRMLVPLLFPKTERRHLLNLRDGRTQTYRGGNALKIELRHLRACGLISMKRQQHVSNIPDNDSFDLAEYVELTPFGTSWLERLRELEKGDTDSAS
jgi:hypothetical protein